MSHQPKLHPRIISDLRFVFSKFPTECLLHLSENFHRLVSGVYRDEQGRGCLFFLLSELLAAPIDSREALTRYFTGGSGDPYKDFPVYQPAKWLVRIIDGEPVKRYGDQDHLPWSVVREILDEAIAARTLSRQSESPQAAECDSFVCAG